MRLSRTNDLNLVPQKIRITDHDKCTPEAVNNSTLRNPPPMRLQKPRLCDSQVRQYSGYIDMEDKHVFFWYFGSRARLSPTFNAATDNVPLVFWFSGGPGCSSQIANWQENGPCMYVPKNATFDPSMSDEKRKALPHEVQRNPWAWNNVADIVFVDQPVGTGFSYGPMPSSTEGATDTAWRTMQAVYAKLTEDARTNGEVGIKDVYLFGESYAGRYIPVFTEYLIHMNKHVSASADLQERGYVSLPLRGIGIGNGMFDHRLQASSAHTIACQSNYPPMFSRQQCAHLKSTVVPQCTAQMNKCYGEFTPTTSSLGMRMDKCVRLEPEKWRSSKECAAAKTICNGALNWTNMVNAYDVRPQARMVPDDYVEYLRTREFTNAIGVTESGVGFEECSDEVFDRFGSTSDEMSRSALSSLQFILNQNMPVLLYSGDADFICNWHGNLAVARALNWHGKGAFKNAISAPWNWPTKSGNKVGAGEVLSAENLTFLRVFEAGHEVPYYQPQASLYMLAQFITSQKVH
ncbi:hypothetical protein LPJ66_007438 [Kickxella alabastrina]|uniref:Uncharacterized protein n=1 Tax=Kickxella alabastrina TaxID=61397 RepID=A0ACC1I9I4_9FUNG|nr:hypothetical protein LPJ66_007438 [Kickxella alabastrina]